MYMALELDVDKRQAPVCFNTVRNMLGYTGTYHGQEISVMGAGMGMPSMGIYSYELFHFYDVDEIIRIGSAGALQDHVNVRDVVLAIGACTDSSYAHQDVYKRQVSDRRFTGKNPVAMHELIVHCVSKQSNNCLLYTSRP